MKTGLFIGLMLLSSPADACRLALVLAMDVSSSVDSAEDRLQRAGLAAALIAPDVQAAFFASPDPVAIQVFEWSGRSHQSDLLDWTLITDPSDLMDAANIITTSARTADGLPTAMGYALGYAAMSLGQAPACLFQTVDISGDGANNSGFGAASVYATFPYDGVTVNGLVITGAAQDAIAHYTSQVIRGPGAFVEVAEGFADFQAAMQRKLIRELSSQVMGQAEVQTAESG